MRLLIMDTRKLLEELENVINNASEVPFTNKKMVDKDEVERLINRKLYIPNYPAERETSESLNVAIATAVVCAESRRQAAMLQCQN